MARSHFPNNLGRGVVSRLGTKLREWRYKFAATPLLEKTERFSEARLAAVLRSIKALLPAAGPAGPHLCLNCIRSNVFIN